MLQLSPEGTWITAPAVAARTAADMIGPRPKIRKRLMLAPFLQGASAEAVLGASPTPGGPPEIAKEGGRDRAPPRSGCTARSPIGRVPCYPPVTTFHRLHEMGA